MPAATIRIFLVDGTPLGIRVVDKSTGTGRGTEFSRADWGRARIREDFSKPGVYVLWGPADNGGVRVYIGEADELRGRINQHFSGPNAKDFWTRAIAFTTKDENLNKATDTFVLDFRNQADAITDAFAPWYERTVAIPTDPNTLHDMADRLLGLQVIDMTEAMAVAALIADRSQKVTDHGAIYAALAEPVERYKAMQDAEQAEVRDALDANVRAYSFLSQVVQFGDIGLEALYLASRALLAELPTEGAGRLDLGAEVELTHLRLEKTSEGSITPEYGDGQLHAIYSGRGSQIAEDSAPLSSIIEVLNERFGMMLGTADQLFFDQMEASWLADDHLVDQARANPLDNFRLVFADKFLSMMVARMDDNQDLFKRVLDDPAFQTAVLSYYTDRIYSSARVRSD